VSQMTSAQRKLARGVEHVKTLRAEAETFVDDDAYVFSEERETRSANEVVYRCFSTENRPPPDHWPLLAGEAIQNLRAALDHAVWELVPKRHRGISEFPITTDFCEFQVNGRKKIPGVPPAVAALIEQAQPYAISPNAPRRASLELLRRLSNIDKHRTLATVACGIQHEFIGTYAEATISQWRIATGKPLGHGKTEISSFIVTSEAEPPQVDVSPAFTYEVRIEGMPLDILVGIVKRVFESVNEVESGKPKSPAATYPI
jgi:hypothetical protein